MTDVATKAPWHLYLVGVIAVLFNAIGAFDFVMFMAQGPAYLAGAGMSPDQIAHYRDLPTWMMIIWAVGVFGAFLGSMLLLMRRKAALPVFVVSLLAYLVNLFYSYVVTDGGALMGRQMAVTSMVITGLLLAFCGYAWFAVSRRVIR